MSVLFQILPYTSPSDILVFLYFLTSCIHVITVQYIYIGFIIISDDNECKTKKRLVCKNCASKVFGHEFHLISGIFSNAIFRKELDIL